MWRFTMSRSSFIRISLGLFFLGLLIIFSSVSLGSGTANAYLAGRGGGFMDASEFTIILEGYINVYRWVGSILSVISGLGFVKAIELK
jgi:hypothetical protein